MEYALVLGTMALIQLLAVISPGQSFVIVSKLSLSEGRNAGIAASIGMGMGSVIWAIAAIAGMAFVLENLAWLYSTMKVLGAGFLIFLAIQLWRHAPEKLQQSRLANTNVSFHKALILGLMTQLANPKVIVFFGSIFFTLIPPDSPTWVYACAVAIIFFNETLWFSMVSIFFSVKKSQDLYLSIKTSIDRIMAIILGGLGLGLLYDTTME